MQHFLKNTKYGKENLRDLAKTEYKQDLQTDLEAFLPPLTIIWAFSSPKTPQIILKCFCHLSKATYMPKVSRLQIHPCSEMFASSTVDYMGWKGSE